MKLKLKNYRVQQEGAVFFKMNKSFRLAKKKKQVKLKMKNKDKKKLVISSCWVDPLISSISLNIHVKVSIIWCNIGYTSVFFFFIDLEYLFPSFHLQFLCVFVGEMCLQ